MKILIADDHTVVREGLKLITEKATLCSVIDEAVNGDEALTKIMNNEYDLVILDISMPGKSGLDVLIEMKNKNIKIPVLILSVHPQEQYAIRAFKLGASGYLCKNSLYEELAIAINKILAGGKYISSALAEILILNYDIDLNKVPHKKLSAREFQVMCMIARGKSVKDIATDLFISDKTVSTHRIRILEKMGMKKNTDIIFYAIKNHLVE
jgi:DNA-binding NarL/FixJ family response regulator